MRRNRRSAGSNATISTLIAPPSSGRTSSTRAGPRRLICAAKPKPRLSRRPSTWSRGKPDAPIGLKTPSSGAPPPAKGQAAADRAAAHHPLEIVGEHPLHPRHLLAGAVDVAVGDELVE